jgi:Fuc2NAc and GlcNAc transferase
MFEFFILPMVFLFAVAVTAAIRTHALRSRLLALPSNRGLHEVPTPVGGGLAIVLAYLVTVLFVTVRFSLGWVNAGLLVAALPVAVAGYADDRLQLDAGVRLIVQFCCAFAAVILAGDIPALPLGPWLIDGAVLQWLLVPVSLVWLCNLYNFMDGIDGLAGMEAAFVCLAASLLLVWGDDVPLALLCLGLFSASCGFLVWNLAPARIFMGDVGSGFLGLTLGLVALVSYLHGSMSLWSWVILLACFVIDATFTLVRRLLRGEKMHQAHKQHAYQHAATSYRSHGKVGWMVTAINLMWLFPIAALSNGYPEHGVYFAALAIVPLWLLAYRLDAGRESR